MIASDTTGRAIPVIHAVGVTALFIGPFFSATDSMGRTTTARFSVYRQWLTLFEDQWIMYVAFAGIVAAVSGALLINPTRSRLRLPVIILGSLTGLTLPVMFFVQYSNGIPVSAYIETWAWGLSAYTSACVASALIAVVLAYLDRKAQ